MDIGDAGLFYLLFCTVYCRENRLKIKMTPYGEKFIIQLTELKLKIWRVIFLKKKKKKKKKKN